uniref:Uncharacterized protein n=1 Tax=Cucumis melo TaxID=3656 RepID=A0A9I9E900_CUCME
PRPRDHRPLVQSSPPPCSVFTTIHESPTLKTTTTKICLTKSCDHHCTSFPNHTIF